MNKSEPLKKLTPGTVMGVKKDDRLPVPESHTVLYTVYGVVTGVIDKPTQHNKNQKLLMGRFEAVRASDRQTYTSLQLYLPDNNYQEQLAAACRNKDTGEISEISCAFLIGYKAGASPTGYVWTVEPVLDTKAQDALADVRKMMPFDKILPALAAPSQEKAGGDAGKKK